MQMCTVRSCVVPLQCQISHLTPYTSYTVDVRSCVPGENACSSAVEKSFTTLIQCKRILVNLYFLVKRYFLGFIYRKYSLFTAPAGLSTGSGSPSSMKVSIRESTESTNVTLYKVSTTGSSCQVSADATPLMCIMESLHGGMKYTVEAVACVSDIQCSRPAKRDSFTIPDSKHGHYAFVFFHKYFHINF